MAKRHFRRERRRAWLLILRNYGPHGFAISGLIIFLSLIGVLILQQMDATDRTSLLIRHNQGVLGDVNQLGLLIRDAETGQRGYLLTGDPAYLRPYEAARAHLRPLIERLQGLLRDDPWQQQRLAALLPLMQQKFDELAQTVELRASAGEEPARRVVMQNRGLQLMEQITPLLDTMATEDSTVLGERTAMMARAQARTRLLAAAGCAAAMLFVAVAILLLRRGVVQRRRIEAEMALRQHELRQSNAELQEFAYAASHDLKAPLRAIGHLAAWIREDLGGMASADMTTNLRLLEGRVVRLQMLLEGLLAYARVGRSDAAIEDVDVAEVVREVAAMLDLPRGFAVVCEGAMPVIRTHRTPIQLVLQNLIGNAVQHHDRAEARITVAMRLLNGVAEFRVGDDGPGIAKQYHERIFMIFQTLKSRDEKESTGIGLAIVKKKVERNGGQIRVESDPPVRGATFVFTWKVTRP